MSAADPSQPGDKIESGERGPEPAPLTAFAAFPDAVTTDILPPRLEECHLFHSLMTATSQAVWLTDPEGRVVDASPSWCAFTGQTEEETRGSSWLNAVHPADRHAVTQEWQYALQSKLPYDGQHRLRHVSGSWRWTVAHADPVINDAGEISGWIGINSDVTLLKNAEAAATEAEERLRLLVENATGIAIFALDQAGGIRSWSTGAARITGYEINEVLGRHFAIFFPAAQNEARRPASLLEQAAREGETKHESWLERKDAKLFWADMTMTASRGPDGMVSGFSNILRDRTDERGYLTALEESEKHSRLLLENAAQGILGVTPNGRIGFANTTACRIFGYSREELQGQPVEVLLPEALRHVQIGHGDSFAADPHGPPMGVGRELSGRLKSGEVFPVEVTLSHLRTSKEGPIHIAFVTDISDRRRDRQALNDSLEQFRYLAETVPQLVWTCLPDGRCDYLNQRWVDYTGVPVHEQLGFLWLDQVHPEDRPLFVNAWETAVTGPSAIDVELRLRRHDGAYRWFRARASALRNDAGAVAKWFGTSTDIHDLRLAMKQLETANADLESFAYIAAHDMQEPLRIISSFTQLLERELAGKVEGRSVMFMEHIRSAARRVSQLFLSVLNYTEAGRDAGAKTELVNLSRCATLAVSNLQTSISEVHGTVMVGHLPAVQGDERHFLQVFQHLISNAIRYRGAADPVVDISATSTLTHCVIRVADNGIGIEEQDRENIFKPFARLHRSGNLGAGIGLAICRRVVSRYGGRLWVESVGANEGSTFLFEIPLP